MITKSDRRRVHTTAIIAVVCLVMAAAAAAAAAESAPVGLVIDGKKIAESPAPRIIGGTTYAPLRLVAKHLEITVDWHAKDKRAVLCRGEWCMVFFAGTDPDDGRIIDGRMFVPLRTLATSLGAKIEYDAAKRRVVVTSPPKKPTWLKP